MISFKKAAIILVFAVGLLLRGVLLVSEPDSVVRIVPDDAFYYFQTARHIVAGNGSTFDGTYPANGYHPLWMVVILPIAVFASDPLTFVRVALGLGILFSFLSALVLYALLGRITDIGWIPLAGVYLYFLDPRTIASSLNGLETSISTLLFVISLYLILSGSRIRSDDFSRPGIPATEVATTSQFRGLLTLSDKSKSIGHEAVLGLSLGLLLLARTDNAFYVMVFFLIAIVQEAKPFRLRRGLVLAGIVAVVISPWFIWNWAEFGSPMQSSALAVPYVLHESYLREGHTTTQMLMHSAERFLSFLGGPGLFLASSAAAVVVSLLVFSRYRRDTHPDDQPIRRSILVVLSLWSGGMLLIFTHAFLRWHLREWYFDQLGLLSAVSLCLTLVVVTSTRAWSVVMRRLIPAASLDNMWVRIAIVMVGTAAVTVPLVRGIELYMTGVFPQQVELLDAAHWLRTHLGEDESAGAFNAGILAFFSGRRVVNFDGAINNAAYAAIRSNELMKFIHQSGASYYLDYDPVMLKLYSAFLGQMMDQVKMSVVHEIDRPEVSWSNSNIGIYRLSWLK